MPPFKLILHLFPAFYRHCSIQIESEVTGLATFEASPTGLLPRVVLTLPVESGRMARLHGCCSSMFSEWDKQWSTPGCDGITIHGSFCSSDSTPQSFMLWSPDKGSAANAMLSAALDCFPCEHCSGAAGELLEIVRSYFDLQPPVVVTGDVPQRLRFAPWVHANDANEIERTLRALPDHGDLIVDVSGVERLRRANVIILPLARLLKRNSVVHWVVQSVDYDALIAYGVDASMIEIVQPTRLSPMGDPIVLGGLEISSPELITLARNGTRIEVVRALREAYRLTIEQAATAARELLDILAANPITRI